MFALFKLGARAAVLVGLSLFAASTLAAAPAAPKLAPYHQPPWLVQPGRQVTLAYALLPAGVTGTVYVRNDQERTFTPLPLVHGTYCPGDPTDVAAMRRDKVCGDALVAHMPGRLVTGSRLYYYAVLRGPGRSVTVPSSGRERPQRVWVVAHPIQVSLGVHRFGHLRRPDAFVARADAKHVGLSCCADPPGGSGPSSFDIARDGSVWMLDALEHRILVWRRGHASEPARAIQLPRNLAFDDFALARNGRIYARAADTADRSRARNKRHLYSLTAAGRIRWQAPIPPGIPTAQLQIGPSGAVYAAFDCGARCAPFGGNGSWMPLSNPVGRPLSLGERARLATPFEPLPGGLQLVSRLSYTVASFALVDRDDRIVRAWRVTSRTRLGSVRAAPSLVGSRLVVPVDISAGPRWEQLILQLSATGGTHFSLAGRPILGDNLVAPLRISSDGPLYQLRTDTTTGATVAAYSLRIHP